MEDSEISSFTMALILEGGLVGECNCKTCLSRTKMYLSFLTHIHGQSVLEKRLSLEIAKWHWWLPQFVLLSQQRPDTDWSSVILPKSRAASSLSLLNAKR